MMPLNCNPSILFGLKSIALIIQTSRHRFVDRYIPGYVFFGDGVTDGYIDGDGTHHAPPWSGQGIRILIDEHREVVGVGEL